MDYSWTRKGTTVELRRLFRRPAPRPMMGLAGRPPREEREECVVLVTGGCSFLGRRIVEQILVGRIHIARGRLLLLLCADAYSPCSHQFCHFPQSFDSSSDGCVKRMPWDVHVRVLDIAPEHPDPHPRVEYLTGVVSSYADLRRACRGVHTIFHAQFVYEGFVRYNLLPWKALSHRASACVRA